MGYDKDSGAPAPSPVFSPPPGPPMGPWAPQGPPLGPWMFRNKISNCWAPGDPNLWMLKKVIAANHVFECLVTRPKRWAGFWLHDFPTFDKFFGKPKVCGGLCRSHIYRDLPSTTTIYHGGPGPGTWDLGPCMGSHRGGRWWMVKGEGDNFKEGAPHFVGSAGGGVAGLSL